MIIVTVEPTSVAWSAEQDVVFTWEAVANAADYVVTWGDREPVTVEEPTLTIPAATVRELVIGSYPVTVVAQPVETSTKYKASAAGEAKFEVTKITLGTPEVTVTPSTLDAGTAQEVVVSWPAVADAETYAVTFNGQTTNLSEPSLTLAADVVSALAAGRYEITVVAQKPSDADHYADSAAGAGELEIKAVGAATTLSWNFSDAGFDAVAAAIGTSDNKTYSGEWNGLNVAAGGKSIKIDTNANDPYTRGLRLGGSGSTTERVLSFTAPASGTVTVVTSATGSTTDEERNILVQAGSAEPESKMAIVRMSKELVTNTFDITVSAPTTIYVYADASINVYKVEFSYVDSTPVAQVLTFGAEDVTVLEAAFPNVTPGDKIQSAQIAEMTTSSEITKSDDNLSFSYKGFTFYAGSGSFKLGTADGSNRVQLGGSGATNKQCVIFEAGNGGKLEIEAQGGAGRNLIVTDGTTEIGKYDTETRGVFTYDCNSVAAGTKLYIYSSSSSINLFSITYTPN